MEEYWAIVGPKLRGTPGDPDYWGTNILWVCYTHLKCTWPNIQIA